MNADWRLSRSITHGAIKTTAIVRPDTNKVTVTASDDYHFDDTVTMVLFEMNFPTYEEAIARADRILAALEVETYLTKKES